MAYIYKAIIQPFSSVRYQVKGPEKQIIYKNKVLAIGQKSF